ncbi:MAG: PQQ-binding-like beta-propeller repeat protein [Candidatus Kapaibacteriota bacterium]
MLYTLKRRYRDQDILLAACAEGYVLYAMPSLKVMQTVRSSAPLSGTGRPPISGSTMYCLMQGKEITAYNLAAGKTVWSITVPQKPAKWLGVTLGTFDDMFTDYILNKDGSILYATTIFGSLYKINAATGTILKQVERFRGDANNAGLITNFSLADVNSDGVEDLIGSAVDYNLYAISGKDLSMIWSYNTGYENQAGVSLYDITGDGIVDVFSINDKMKLSILNGKTGAKIHEHQIQPEKSQAKVILADINGNGLLDIFISGGSKAIRAYEMPSVKVPVGGVVWMPEGL